MSDCLKDWQRSHSCGALRKEDIGKIVTLMGWVDTRRDHGGLIFIDLRDREGITQIVFNPQQTPSLHKQAHHLRSEFVIGIKGKVEARPEGTVNSRLPSGEIEVRAEELKIINTAQPLPFPIEEKCNVSEEIRLRYRYLDLRRPPWQKTLFLYHKACLEIRNFLDKQGFLEIETPVLTKSTPEGARDFLVPSRLLPGHFYALPQSPQLFKQLLMIAGYEKYFQIARCFRDEDLRADRQLEHTQVDVEMSFVNEENIFNLMEKMIAHLFLVLLKIKINLPFPRLSFTQAMEDFGTDKPDLRFGLELKEISEALKNTKFKIFKNVLGDKGVIKGINVRKAKLSTKEIEELVTLSRELGAEGLAWMHITGEGAKSPIAKFFTDAEIKTIQESMQAENGDLLLFVADKREKANFVLGQLRLHLRDKLGLVASEQEGKREFKFAWIINFPLLEWSEEEERFKAMHHPFTTCQEDDLPALKKYGQKQENEPAIKMTPAQRQELLNIKACAYDLVLNGVEIGGGSLRNYRREIQENLFTVLGIGKKEAEEKFGFLLEALGFGAPPHGGIALGLARLLMLITGKSTIREVIAFPKTQTGTCPLTAAPSRIEEKQLKELFIKTTLPREKD